MAQITTYNCEIMDLFAAVIKKVKIKHISDSITWLQTALIRENL